MTKPTMAIQLYTLRDHIKTAEDFDSTLARLKAMGVKDVQISGIGDFPAAEQKKILDKHGISVCVTHKSFEWLRDQTAEAVEHHKTICCNAIGIGSAPQNGRGNSGRVREFISDSKKIAEAFKQNGMTFNYHNHSFEFYRLDDCKYSMMDLLINETNPELFHFIPDVAWIDYSGNNPVEVLKKMAGRVKVLHFKDYIFDNDGNRKFVSLGNGVVDLKACYEAACELNIPYIAYEQDSDWSNGDAFEATEQSWEYMQKLIK